MAKFNETRRFIVTFHIGRIGARFAGYAERMHGDTSNVRTAQYDADTEEEIISTLGAAISEIEHQVREAELIRKLAK